MDYIKLFEDFENKLNPFTRGLFDLDTKFIFSFGDPSDQDPALTMSITNDFFDYINLYGFNVTRTPEPNVFKAEGKINLEDIEKIFPPFKTTERSNRQHATFIEIIDGESDGAAKLNRKNAGELFWTEDAGFFQLRPLYPLIKIKNESEDLSDFTKDIFGLTTELNVQIPIIAMDSKQNKAVAEFPGVFLNKLEYLGLNPELIKRTVKLSGYYLFIYKIDGDLDIDDIVNLFPLIAPEEVDSLSKYTSTPYKVVNLKCWTNDMNDFSSLIFIPNKGVFLQDDYEGVKNNPDFEPLADIIKRRKE